MRRQREEEGPRGSEPSEENSAEHQHHAREEKDQVGEQDCWTQLDIPGEEIPHHSGAAESRDGDHADAVCCEQLIEARRRNCDDTCLRRFHEETKDHEKREDERRDAYICRNESAAAGGSNSCVDRLSANYRSTDVRR